MEIYGFILHDRNEIYLIFEAYCSLKSTFAFYPRAGGFIYILKYKELEVIDYKLPCIARHISFNFTCCKSWSFLNRLFKATKQIAF